LPSVVPICKLLTDTSGNVKSKDITLSKQLCHNKFINWWMKVSDSGCELEDYGLKPLERR
jgi:hypothetical protein